MDLVQEVGRFLDRETYVGAQFKQLVARTQPGQRQRRIGTGQQNKCNLRRQMIEQEGQRLVNGRVVDDVIVVQHQDQAIRGALQAGSISAGSAQSSGGGCDDRSAASNSWPTCGRRV